MFERFCDRVHRCVIVVDEVTNFIVQKFADENCVDGSIVNIVSYCGVNAVAFDTHKNHDVIFEKLQKEFGADFNVRKRGIVIVSVTKKGS